MLDSEPQASEALTFDVATAAIMGSREYQEDSIVANFPLGQANGFAVVADGVGGHAAGNVASAIATTEVFGHLKRNEQKLESHDALPLLLREAAETANKRIAEHGDSNDETYGMGSTLLVPTITGDKLWWISIGDSPLLLFRAGALRQLNQDHSMAPQIDMMVKMGSMTAEAGQDHPDRNTLTSILNGKEIPMIDCPATPLTIQPGDILVASTDGLQSVSNAVIANTLMLVKDAHGMAIANALLAAIAHRDCETQDNAAFTVIKVRVAEQEPTSRNAEDLPVLAVADTATPAAPVLAEPQVAEPEPPKKKLKTYFYRGQEYTKEE